jgi:integrase
MPRPNNGPQLKQGKDGIWVIRYCKGGRSRERSTGTRDPAIAQSVFGEFLILFSSGEVAAPVRHLTVRDAFGSIEDDQPEPGYWHEHVLRKVAGKETQRRSARHVLAHFGPMLVKDVRPEHVDAYIAKRQRGAIGKPSKDSTIGRELSVLTAAINHAVRAKRISSVDTPSIERPPESAPRERWLTKEEARRLMAAARGTAEKLPRVYRFIAIALATASRKQAILDLRRNQIDMQHGLIHFNPAGRQQTNKRRAALPISDELRPVLEQTLKEIEGNYVLDHNGSLRKAFDSACRRAGLEDVTPHTLRHTKATWLAQAGVPLSDIAGLLADSIRTVEKNYLHHCPEHLRGAVNAVKIAA